MSSVYADNFYNAVIISHHDGDTTHILADVGFDLDIHLTVRWYGVNAPELATPEGKAALAWVNATLPPGSAVRFKSAKDPHEKYGRYLATFFLGDGTNVNDVLIATGHAVAYFGGTK